LKQNKVNVEYNAGVVAGQKTSQGINFTAGSHDKSFCAECNTSAYFSEGCAGDFLFLYVESKNLIAHSNGVLLD
jgi:hypothetical protein